MTRGRYGQPGLPVHPDNEAIWLPVLVAYVETGRWMVRCPDCGRPNDHSPEVGYRSSQCKCEAMRLRRLMDGYVIAPPGAMLVPYPDYCAKCGVRTTIYTPVDLHASESGRLVASYVCELSHLWECFWGDVADPPVPTAPRGQLARRSGGGRKCALYRHFDEFGTLLYVGISERPVTRGKDHAETSAWVEFAVRIEAEWLPDRATAEVAERRAIQTEGPVFNVAHIGPNDVRVAAYLARREALVRA